MFLLHGSIAEPAIVQTQQSPHLGINEGESGPAGQSNRRSKTKEVKTMSTAYVTAIADRSAWTAPIAFLRDAWSRYRVYRRTYAELDALTTRDLDDLGISRSMITRLAYEAAYGQTA